MSILVLMLAATIGVEPAPPTGEGVFVAPDWVRKPTAMEINDVYPLRSSLIGEEGEVVITCSVALSGMAENCRVLSETPEGRGFGEAALKASKVMRFRPAMRDGRPVADAWVSVPLSFGSGPPASLPGLSEALACYGRFSARLRANPTDTKADLGAQWSRYWADKSMKLERITKPYREKRLAAAAAKFSAPPVWSDADVRCEAVFLPEAPA